MLSTTTAPAATARGANLALTLPPMVTDATVRWYKSHHLRVNVWTVDDPAEMKRLIALGVDSIITNKPDVLGALVQ